MFSRLIDFSSKRTPQEAFGFYLFYALVAIILCSVAGGIASIFSRAADFHEGFAVGAQVGPFVSGLQRPRQVGLCRLSIQNCPFM